jgi:hypothetical protein
MRRKIMNLVYLQSINKFEKSSLYKYGVLNYMSIS